MVEAAKDMQEEGELETALAMSKHAWNILNGIRPTLTTRIQALEQGPSVAADHQVPKRCAGIPLHFLRPTVRALGCQGCLEQELRPASQQNTSEEVGNGRPGG
jgi:hypothetical protein